MKQNSYLNAVQSARALLDSIKPAKTPRYDAMTNIALVSMEDIHRSACERIKGKLPWECDKRDFRKYGPIVIPLLSRLLSRQPENMLLDETHRLVCGLADYLNASAPSGTTTDAERQRLLSVHNGLVDEFQALLLNHYLCIYPYAAQEALGVERHDTESRRILKALHALKAGQRKILSFVSDDPATYEERDGRRVSKARERMVALAVAAIRDGAEGDETAIAHRFFSRFRDLPDAYDNFESFMRQVRRTMSA